MALENRPRRALWSNGRHVEPTMITWWPAEAKRGRPVSPTRRKTGRFLVRRVSKFNFPTRGGQEPKVKSGAGRQVSTARGSGWPSRESHPLPRAVLTCSTELDCNFFRACGTRNRNGPETL